MNKAILMDLDGTLVNNWIPLEGSIELINYINQNNIPYYIVTNRESMSIEEIEKNLHSIGIKINKNRIINPIIALDKFIKDNSIMTFYFVGPKHMNNTTNGIR